MSEPSWLLTMRAMTGLTETPGSADNPKILGMRDAIAAAYPDMAAYCATYQHDSTAWCGLAAAYCMTEAGIRPPWGPTDTDRFLWAQSFDDPSFATIIEQPRPGCVVVMKREGGGHVSFWERTEGSNYVCRGGNQSDMVNESKYAISSVISLVWPKAAGTPPPAPRRTIQQGDSGPDVVYLQKALGIPADGEFGPVSKGAVKGFQTATGLASDGVCGPATWTKIDELVRRLAAGSDGLTPELKAAIADLASRHPINDFDWEDRGHSPPGYAAGVGMAYALALTWLESSAPAAVEMAQAAGDPAVDALAYYGDDFAEIGISVDTPGAETLRALHVMLLGLGMRESSGRCCEGRDTGASNVTSDTAEAGLFQTSWNIRTASPNIPPLLELFWADPNGFHETFAEGVNPAASELENYGSGSGAAYQFLAKRCPVFACMTTAIGLRTRRSHWGPISRTPHEVEIVEEADDFLRQVDGLVYELPVPEPRPPEPEAEAATVDIVTSGKVVLRVNGTLVAATS
jgi:uncharacterized protein (TIGR02594 family)